MNKEFIYFDETKCDWYEDTSVNPYDFKSIKSCDNPNMFIFAVRQLSGDIHVFGTCVQHVGQAMKFPNRIGIIRVG